MILKNKREYRGDFKEIIDEFRLKTEFHRLMGFRVDSEAYWTWYDAIGETEEVRIIKQLFASKPFDYTIFWDNYSDGIFVIELEKRTIDNWQEFLG